MYTKTNWSETGMTTQNKVDGLNNLETIYSNAINAIDSIDHKDRYYTKTEVSSKYFSSDSDGDGSGLIAATLDGRTAQQIMDAGTPAGCIAIWPSALGQIPSGWALCDGSNGTPDLRDKFVVGAGGNYALYESGGSNTVTASGSVTIGGHALTESEVPKHTHGSITDTWVDGSSKGTYSGSGVYKGEKTSYTNYAGGGQPHTHSASFTGTPNQQKMPPYYALAYIMKV
jgi:microcystin-dependent protein